MFISIFVAAISNVWESLLIMDAMFDENLLQEFVTEGREHLANIEPDLLALETQREQVDADMINRIFRAIHSIKGASGFFGFEAVKKLSHLMETLLMLFRDGKLLPSPALIDPLLNGVDKLSLMMNDIQNSESVAYAEEAEKLEAIISGNPPFSPNASETSDSDPELAASNAKTDQEVLPRAFEGFKRFEHALSGALAFPNLDIEHIETSQKSGQRFYRLRLNWPQYRGQNVTAKELFGQLQSVGSILAAWTDGNPTPINELVSASQHAEDACWIISSVLETDLLCLSFPVIKDDLSLIEDPKGLLNEPMPTVTVASSKQERCMSDPSEDDDVALSTDINTASEAAVLQTSQKITSEASISSESKTSGKKSALDNTNGASANSDTVRVRIDLLNKLMDLAGEMVLGRNQLLRTLAREKVQAQGLAQLVQNIDLITTDLQEHIMQTRMQPIGSVFGKFPRIVRDMAKMLNKQILLEMSGEDVALDKSIIECLSDPLTHLIRNCCDHALEQPEERLAAGKDTQGTIWLKAYHQDGQINIAIIDDGRGINADKIAAKALEKGLITETDVRRMSIQEKVNLIFLPGLSTAEKVSEISGRGVGMDVVRTNIEKLGGHISIETEVGQGTTLLLRLPLTLAIIPSLIVGVADQRFAIPQINLLELVRVKAADVAEKIEKVGNASVLRLRGKLLPLLRLADVLNISRHYADPRTGEKRLDRRQEVADIRVANANKLAGGQKVKSDRRKHADKLWSISALERQNRRQHPVSDYNILVLKVGSNQFGLIIDELFDPEEIVVKPLSGYLQDCKCFAGSAIMGDGHVAMIVDAGGIINTTGISFEEINAQHEQEALLARARASVSGDRRNILLFNVAEHETFAFPLSSVMRLEKIDLRNITHMGDQEFITYYGQGLPILRLDKLLPIQPMPQKDAHSGASQDAFLILPNEANGKVGILTSRILDATEVNINLDRALGRYAGVEGSAIVNNTLTLFIEPEGLLNRAGVLANV
ncbi:MAG: chemotaxis protein CheW [Vampirovibrionales bacterium]|nr:chemotaxis protein CheW [Vampirovibrionales bacterium]